MKVKEGYKETKLGIIPKEWEIVSFESISDKTKRWNITGGPFGSNLKTTDYTIDGVQIIQLQNIGDGRFIDDYQIYTSDKKADELLSSNIFPNEIILSKMGDPVARACFIPNKAKRYLMASDGIRLVVNEKEFSKKFVHDYINSNYFRLRAFEISTGTTRLRIGLPQLKKLFVIKPPLTEQTAIATALSDTDALIESLEKLIAKKRLIKQGAMQELLKPKEGWEVKKLGNICDVRDGTHDSPNYIEDGTIFITSKNIINGKFDYSDISYISEEDAKKINQRSKVDKGDIIMSMIGTIGNAVLVDFEPNFCIKNVALFKPRSIYPQFLIQLIYSSTFQKYIESKLDGGIQKFISLGVLRDLDINQPNLKEQTRIATILSDMDREIEALEGKLEKYRKIKVGMMQQLLTGKIRLV